MNSKFKYLNAQAASRYIIRHGLVDFDLSNATVIKQIMCSKTRKATILHYYYSTRGAAAAASESILGVATATMSCSTENVHDIFYNVYNFFPSP